ncbi:MAG: integration host factor, actinobacterial type [Rothia sp. (in: high G+C Gram-positive bacteria)]|uniref:integration host factor, actinobacterial type n=1 Tax=Rothia sp. (in: high G+C Gram-positive bacteria) TaxID=1885016 RepID=UPI0026E03393|nr:integration host factor, actinobacterial type [Rothia sp. (in: high G+C Gram-positive bacteria)]MDO5750680.1 integration host factor, actinobacterial type [Rothia sp. (in: high G+C Gram-positive bacteria)]
MPLSPLTEQARAVAREKAVAARTHRQDIKQKLSDRTLSVREVLDMVDSDPVLAKMPVDQMLRALPGIGAVRAQSIMSDLDIAPSRRLGGLGVHQRRKMVEFFNRNARLLNRARRNRPQS